LVTIPPGRGKQRTLVNSVKSVWTVGSWNRDKIREDKRESLMGEKEM
jgi:hypothetical protein